MSDTEQKDLANIQSDASVTTSAVGNRTVAIACVVFVASMVGMSYAAVPLYKLFCQVTGYGGTPQVATSVPTEILDREITVRFDANTAKDLPWKFGPKARSVKVKIGEVRQIDYIAENLSGETSWGTAGFNVTPDIAGLYFNKVDCFCFTEQKLAAGETTDMPVLFFIDPEIVNDKNFGYIDTITLSYTFYRNDPPESDTAAAPKVPTEASGDERG